ncbi:MAG: hypothetical protein HYV42_01150 [Candidatus Magasanikbacteria bacterium]|nr:hypothetical protein [Candidatus Magasanikbacteria bacterium]
MSWFNSLKKQWWLVIILAVAFLLRLPGIGYGLPFHLLGDEEAHIYGALKMLEIPTLLPVFHWAAFNDLLYYPPLLSYLYLLIFVVALGVKFLAAGLPALVQFKAMIAADPSALWLTARSLNVVLSVAGVYLVYRLGRQIFKNYLAAAAAALFLATSFLDVTLAPTARHWVPAIFLSLLAWVAAWLPEGIKRWRMALPGVLLGLSFGAGYLVFYFPLVLLTVWWSTPRLPGARRIALLYFGGGFLAVALAFIAVHPQPFVEQVLAHTYSAPGEPKEISRFLTYYASTLGRYELPLVIFSLVGLLMLGRRSWRWGLGALLVIGSIAVIMYAFFWNIPRYLLPLLPLFALLAGYGVGVLGEGSRRWQRGSALAIPIFLAVYSAWLFIPYHRLIWRNDTRVAAVQWLVQHLPENAGVLIYSERLRLSPSLRALQIQQQVAPQSLRSAERALASPGVAAPWPLLYTHNLFYVNNSEQRSQLITGLTQSGRAPYLVVDSWASLPPDLAGLPARATLVKEFKGSDDLAGSDSPDGRGALFIGGEAHTVRQWLPPLLWRLPQLGPTVLVYQLSSK